MTQSTTLTMLAVVVVFVVGGPGIPGRVQALQETPISAPESLVKGRTIAVVGKTGKQLKDRLWANPDGARAREKVVAVLSGWGRYQIVDDPVTADLVAVVTEVQKNLSLLRLANLVSELRIYRGGEPITDHTPVLWSGDASESFRKMPSTQAAEKFKDYVTKLESGNSAKVASVHSPGVAVITLVDGEVLEGTVLGRVVVRRADAQGNVAIRVLDGTDILAIDEAGIRANGESVVLAAMQGATQDNVLQALIFWDEGRSLKNGHGMVRNVGTGQVLGARIDNARIKPGSKEELLGEYRIDQGGRTITMLSSVRLKKADGAVLIIKVAEIVASKQ